MATVPIEMRGATLEINVGAGYVEVKGIETLALSESETSSEWTLKEDLGNTNGIISTRTKSIKVTGKYLVDPDTGTRDPGQAAVDTAAALFGYASRIPTKLTLPPSSGGAVEEFYATYVKDDIGGGINDVIDWGFTATRRGANI